MNRKTILSFLVSWILCSIGVLYAQNITVKGTITDGTNGETLIGASVIEKGTTNGVITDYDGNFQISVPANAVLEMSYVGYIKKEITVTNAGPYKVTLVPDNQQLDEVVVVGYGQQKVKDLTAPITTIKGSNLSQEMASNPVQALQGKVAGVQITNTGAPGGGVSVKIRGVGSIGDYANPLYIVDGAFVDNIDFLSSSDIQDLTILKDASAAAIYGVRAANGVVLVTTKRGVTERATISFDTYMGAQTPINIVKLSDKQQYITALNEAFQGQSGYPKDPNSYPGNTDWYNVLTRDAGTAAANLDISGATGKTNYSFGANYFWKNGIMQSVNNYQRFNFRTRIEQTVYDWLKVGANIVYSVNQQALPNTNAFAQAFVNPPVYPVYNAANSAAFPIDFDSPQRYGYGNAYGNPKAFAYYNNNTEKGYNLVLSTFLEVNLLQNKLKYRLSYNADIREFRQRVYTPKYFVGGSQGTDESQLSKTFGHAETRIIDNLITYSDTFGKNNYSILLGQSTRVENFQSLTGTAVRVPDFDDQSLYLSQGGSALKDRYASDAGNLYHGVSFFVRGTWNYDDRYLASATFRADGSSKFQEKWGYFPSIGLGWNVTSEEFMADVDWLNNLKVRGSWGLLGNDNVPANSAVILGDKGIGSSAIFGDYIYDGIGAQTVFQNNIKWETVSEYDFGFDWGVLDNRLTGEFDYYNRTTRNVVFFAPIAAGGGKVELLGNNGKVRNSGFEVTLAWSDKLKNGLKYNAGLNFTSIKNEVLELTGRDFIPGAEINGIFSTRTQVGEPIGSFYGYKIEGVYQTASEIPADLAASGVKPGYFKYKDVNNDGSINENDRTFLGSPIPKVLLGANLGLEYKGFDASIQFTAQLGNKILNAKRMNRIVFSDANYDTNFFDNRWTGANTTNKYPSAQAYNASITQQANSFFVENGSYFSIQNITLGYSFTKIPHIQKLRVYATAQNPLMTFKYNGFTTQIGGSPIASGIDTSVYPMQSIWSLGFAISY
ncbi:MAG: TonB-dependent receptor [Bacteroidales bacterium]